MYTVCLELLIIVYGHLSLRYSLHPSNHYLEPFTAITRFINSRNAVLNGFLLEGKQVWLIVMEVGQRVNDRLVTIIDCFWLQSFRFCQMNQERYHRQEYPGPFWGRAAGLQSWYSGGNDREGQNCSKIHAVIFSFGHKDLPKRQCAHLHLDI